MASLTAFFAVFEREHLIAEFRSGRDSLHVDYRRKDGAGRRFWVAPEDRQKYLDGTDPARICAELDCNGFYELVVHGCSQNCGSVYRKLQHYWLNSLKDSVLIIDSDVTLTYLEQQNEVERAKKDAERTKEHI